MRTAIDLHAPEVWSDPRLTEQIATSTAALSVRYYRTRITEAVVLHAAHSLLVSPMERSRPGPDPLAPKFTSRRGSLKGVGRVSAGDAQLARTEYGRKLLQLRGTRAGRLPSFVAPGAG